LSLSNASAVTTLTASDVERAKAFWTEKLGLEAETTEDPGGGIYLKAGNGTKIFIYNSGEPKATNTVVSFKVDDVLGMVKSLKEKGVEFESYDMDPIKTDDDNISRMGEMEAAWFKDSEGNIVCVSNM
jgi:predicted enzyme related to lactoylglutathione lyase